MELANNAPTGSASRLERAVPSLATGAHPQLGHQGSPEPSSINGTPHKQGDKLNPPRIKEKLDRIRELLQYEGGDARECYRLCDEIEAALVTLKEWIEWKLGEESCACGLSLDDGLSDAPLVDL